MAVAASKSSGVIVDALAVTHLGMLGIGSGLVKMADVRDACVG